MEKRPGYLLIELSIVIALIAFLAGLSISISGFLERMLARGEAEKIAAFLNYTRLRAIGRQESITVQIDLKDQSLASNEEKLKLIGGVKFGIKKNVLGPPSSPSLPVSSPCSFARDEILFYPDGTVSSGTLYLTDKKKKNQYAVTIPLPDVFYVRIYHFQNGAWKRI